MMKKFIILFLICCAFAPREAKRYPVTFTYTQEQWNAHLDTLGMLDYYIGKPMMHSDAEILQGWIRRMQGEITKQVKEGVIKDTLKK